MDHIFNFFFAGSVSGYTIIRRKDTCRPTTHINSLTRSHKTKSYIYSINQF